MKTIMWFGIVLCAVSAAGNVFYATPGKTAKLKCGATSLSVSLIWRRENILIVNFNVKSGIPLKGQSELAQRSRVKGETDLDISDVREDDAGTFFCIVDGKEHTHTLVVVSVSVSPSQPKLGSQAKLTCKGNGLNQGFTVQWKAPDGKMHKETTELNPVSSEHAAGPWTCMITHDGVSHEIKLDLKVQMPSSSIPSPTQRSNGNNKTCPHGCVTNNQTSTDQLSWWIWVAVGVGCLVVVLLMVCVIVLCKSIRRRKRRLQKIKNGRHPLGPKQYCQCSGPTAAVRTQQGRRKEKPTALPLQPY